MPFNGFRQELTCNSFFFFFISFSGHDRDIHWRINAVLGEIYFFFFFSVSICYNFSVWFIPSRCIYLNTWKPLLLAGAHDRTKQEVTEQYFEVSQLYIHKRYQTNSGYGHDIALIRLSRPAILKEAVGLVCLPKQDNRVAVGKTCYLTGKRCI